MEEKDVFYQIDWSICMMSGRMWQIRLESALPFSSSNYKQKSNSDQTLISYIFQTFE